MFANVPVEKQLCGGKFMILPRHPDLMSDQELGEWVHRLVTLKEPASIF